MNHICTWLCADEKGEESDFPQSGKKSSSQSHQNIYWRCLIVFFVSSTRFNKEEKHLLFTNVKQLPTVDGKQVSTILEDLGVEVIHIDFRYKTPKGYFGSFQNQFFEFSILEYIALHRTNADDLYMIVDSDCIFIKPANRLFNEAAPDGFISFEIDSPVDHKINGLSRLDMQELFAELLGKEVNEIPSYHLGEFLLCSQGNIQRLYADFLKLWPILLERNEKGLRKLNEEAHTLSFLYFKNGWKAAAQNQFMKRIWTNPVFYRNVAPQDLRLTLWHLPAEKTFGIARLYDYLIFRLEDYGTNISDRSFLGLVRKATGIPSLRASRKIGYYSISYYKAITKRILKYAGAQ